MPIPIMQREAAAPPIEHTLSYLCKLAAIRLHKLEPSHPLRRRTKKAWSSTRPTRLEQVAKQCSQHTEYSNPLLLPALWENHLFGGIDKCLAAAGHTTGKDKAKENVRRWLNSRNENELIVYSDGSQRVHPNGKVLGTGSAWVIRWKNQCLGTKMVEFTIQEAATIRLFHALKHSKNMRVTLLNIMKSEYFQDESPETK